MTLPQHDSTQLASITAVIVNYRSWGKLKDCLNSLLNAQTNLIALEIIVVDNCSNDAQLATFSELFSTVTFVLNSGNHGFAHGCNTGAKAANGDYLFFINPDTEVPNDVFAPLLSGLSTLPDFSIIATQKITTKGKSERVQRFFPRWFTLTGIGKALHRSCISQQLKEDFPTDKDMVFPEWVSGSVIFMRRKDCEELNGWNENFWMYSEDVDLCKRATNKGGKIALLQNVAIVHNHGGSSRVNPITSALTKSEVYISRHVYIAQHFDKNSLYLIQGLLVMKSIIKTGFFALLSLLLFNHTKAKISRNLFKNLSAYYRHALMNRTWLSPRSVLFKK